MAMNEPPRNGNSADQLVDPELTRLYHECAHEEPPAHLDAVILAAARHEADAASREPAPETDRNGSVLSQVTTRVSHLGQMPHRSAWPLPLSLAAVVVLSASVVALMYNPDVERTAESLSSTPSVSDERSVTPERRSRPATAPGQSEGALRDGRELTEPDAASRRKALERADSARQSAPAPYADQSAAPAAAEASRDSSAPPVPRFAVPLAKEHSTAAAPPPALAAQYAHEPPEKWGEKIVELRRQGRSAEADDLLAEFRRHFPGHVVPEEWMP
jgi:hypothetical protein